MEVEIEKVEHHRNGVGGVPFYVATFRFREEAPDGKWHRLVGITFNQPDFEPDDWGDPEWGEEFEKGIYTAVLDIDMLAKGHIGFGHNSWRGDSFHKFIQDGIRQLNKEIKGYQRN
tara:strand:+ start:532 stop:879 length:348 start_codon:yes stop_codon:yes gene_type:complete